MLSFKPYSKCKSEEIKALLDEIKEDKVSISINNNRIQLEEESYESVYVGYKDTAGLGLVKLRTNKYHGETLYASIYVMKAFRRQGIGSYMLEELNTLTSHKFTQIAFEKADDLEAFLSMNDYLHYRSTYEPTLKVATHKEDYSFDEAVSLKTVDMLKDHEVDDLIKRIVFDYKKTHTDNPLTYDEHEVWKNLVFDDLVADLSLCAYDDNELIAYSMLHESDDEYDQGYHGVRDHEDELLKSLLLKQLHILQDNEVDSLNCEFDDTNPVSMYLMNAFNLEDDKPFLTYQYRK